MSNIELYFHMFVVHFGCWVSALILLDIYAKGLPNKLYPMFKSALILALAMSLVSAHSHMHYLKFVKVTK